MACEQKNPGRVPFLPGSQIPIAARDHRLPPGLAASGVSGLVHIILILVSKLQTKLNGTRLVTLSADLPEISAPIRAWVAEVGPVEDVAKLGVESHLELFPKRENLKQAQILVISREATRGTVGTRRISQLARAGILPC